MLSKESRFQLLSTLCVNIITVCFGVALGWPSASLLILQSDETPLPTGPLSTAQASWISSLIALGGLLGNIVFGWLSGHFGRKAVLLMCAIPAVIGWILIYMATAPVYLYVARLLHGSSGGGVYIAAPVFVAEIANSRIRGTLGSMFMMSFNFGIFLAFVMGHWLAYETLPPVMMAASMCFVLSVMLLPETPQYLLRNGRADEAEESLRFYRNMRRGKAATTKAEMAEIKTDERPEEMALLQTELEMMRATCAPPVTATKHSDDDDDDAGAAAAADDDKITFRDFLTPQACKALFIGAFLLWLKSFTGISSMVNYAGQIFANAGSSVSPNAAAIVVGAIQVTGTYVAILMVDRTGRRKLLFLSTVGTGVSLSVLATYMLLRHAEYPLSGLGWVPLLSFSCVLFFASTGIIPMPFVVMAELMPPKIRSSGVSLGMMTLWVFTFAIMKCYSTMVAMLGMHGCYYVFATCAFIGTIVVALFLPETRGKSFEAIQRSMEGRWIR